MLEQELAQRAVLEALERKIETLRGFGTLHEGVELELLLWDDLSINFPTVFMAATKEEVSLTISKVSEKSNGRFTLETIGPSVKKRVGVLYAGTGVSDNPQEEASLVFWKIRYSEKYKPNNAAPEKTHVFWLTADALIYKPSDRIAVQFRKKGGVSFKLLQFFANNPEMTSSKEIAEAIDTTPRNISEEVSKLRTAISRSIGLDGKSFIESEPGYALAANIKIEEK